MDYIGALASCQELNLFNNQIGDIGLSALAKACADKGALASCQKLILGGNQIGDVGVSALATAIESGALPQVTYVSLFENPGNAEQVERALRERKGNK